MRCSTAAGFCNCPAVILCPPSVLPQDNQMANVASLSICFMFAIYCAQNRYSIFWANLPSTFNKWCGSISLLVVLLFCLHYGSHHYHMGIDLERLVLQSHCPVKYIWECYFSQGHIDRFDFPSFQTVQHSVTDHLLILACGWLQFALQLVQYLNMFQCQ